MSAINFVPQFQSTAVRGASRAPLLRGLRSGCRAFTGELVASVPVLQRRTREVGAEALADCGVGQSERSRGHRRAARWNRIQLTRRGRLLFIGLPVMLATAAVAMSLLILIAPANVTASTEPVQGSGTEIVTVGAGESLWEVAHSADATRDTRVVIAEIVELNDLTSQSVTTGQQLVVPAN